MRSQRLCLFTLLFSAPVFAIPSLCVDDTLTNYESVGFNCTIGDKTFNSFASALTAITAFGTATPTSTDDINVHPTGGSLDPGFSFIAKFDAVSASLISASSVTFTVAYTGFAPVDDPFSNASLFLTDPTVGGLGLITAAEALCKNGSFTSLLDPLLCTGVGVNASLTSNITNANLNAVVIFSTPQVTELGVIKQITLTSGLNGTATAAALNNGYEATGVPEPSYTIPGFLMMVCGFGALRWQRRRCKI